ncbi:hypothetical protein [Fructilactobacillus sanfranciscensis]|uniref:hypothetical protein n=1 Tax=Fructilactobacillus sanfranciscensis TaxID=1625 RepID=UPI0013D1041A|nr:hypothetical protein [Fructilactobacillus sanfranciscensis]NDR76924.1 hypothetical protein [Fructilactobacillus sanfranciscensis]
MKKSAILFSTVLISLSLAACGSKKETSHKDAKPKTEKVKKISKEHTPNPKKLPKHKDVNDFAAKEGKTPAAYLHENENLSVKKSLQVLPNKDKTPQEKQTQQILNNPSKYKDQPAPAPVKETQNNTNQSGTTSNNDPDNNLNIDALNIYKHPEIYSNRGF